LVEQGSYDEAIEECTEAIKLDPNLAIAYNNRAVAYLHMGQYDLAIADCTKAIELDPSLADPYCNGAYLYNERG